MKDRTGLYIMVFFTMMASCSADYNTGKIHEHLHEIDRKLDLLMEERDQTRRGE